MSSAAITDRAALSARLRAGVLLACLVLASPWVLAKRLSAGPADFSAALGQLQPGDTLELQPGIYRAELRLSNLHPGAAQPITIRGAEPSGSVVFSGADLVSTWAAESGGRYSATVDHEPSEVFIDGHELTQLGGTIFNGYPERPAPGYDSLHRNEGGIWPGRKTYAGGSMPDNSFWYDSAAHRLYLKSAVDPRNHSVEASARERVLFAEHVSGLILNNLVIEHANTSVTNRGGAAVVIGDHVQLHRIVARHNDLTGIQIMGDDNLLQDAQAIANGQMGVTARGQRNRLVRVDAIGNNTRGFNKWWEAGGFKFVGDGGLQSSELDGCRAIGNQGDGIWFDWNNDNNLVHNSVSAFNTGFGIHYEASQHGTFEDNWVYGNGQRGIYLSDSGSTAVRHNLVVGNGLEGIVSVYTARPAAGGSVFSAQGNEVAGNVVGWNQSGAVILPRGQGAKARGNVYLGSGDAARFSLGFPSLTNRPAMGLGKWQEASGEDAESALVDMPLPAAVAKALASKQLVPDWSAVQALVQRAQAPAGASAGPGAGANASGTAKAASPAVAPGPRSSAP